MSYYTDNNRDIIVKCKLCRKKTGTKRMSKTKGYIYKFTCKCREKEV